MGSWLAHTSVPRVCHAWPQTWGVPSLFANPPPAPFLCAPRSDCNAPSLPPALTGLHALTSLDLSDNSFEVVGWQEEGLHALVGLPKLQASWRGQGGLGSVDLWMGGGGWRAVWAWVGVVLVACAPGVEPVPLQGTAAAEERPYCLAAMPAALLSMLPPCPLSPPLPCSACCCAAASCRRCRPRWAQSPASHTWTCLATSWWSCRRA